ncbi:MAG: transposase [Verrucomicrobiales bacterium]
MGHDVLVANACKLRAIYTNPRKSDELDAKMLAKLGRIDPSLLYPIAHQSERYAGKAGKAGKWRLPDAPKKI